MTNRTERERVVADVVSPISCMRGSVEESNALCSLFLNPSGGDPALWDI